MGQMERDIDLQSPRLFPQDGYSNGMPGLNGTMLGTAIPMGQQIPSAKNRGEIFSYGKQLFHDVPWHRMAHGKPHGFWGLGRLSPLKNVSLYFQDTVGQYTLTYHAQFGSGLSSSA